MEESARNLRGIVKSAMLSIVNQLIKTYLHNNEKSVVDNSVDMDYNKDKRSNSDKVKLHIDEKQFGKKVGKHAVDFGLDPSNKDGREKVKSIIEDIFYNSQSVKIGEWRGQNEDVLFHIKDEDVVITKQNGEFITIMKGGINNARVKNAREY